MADPYAERANLAPPERLGPESPAADAARAAGGVVLAGLASARGSLDGAFAAVPLEEEAVLPPLARIGPELAAALLCDGRGPAIQDEVLAAAGSLRGSGLPLLLVKSGLVAGPAGRPGAVEVGAARLREALRAALSGEVRWESDPDFGYEVAAEVPGFAGAEADAFCPRLLFAAADRVYEHAELVEVTKRRRHRRLADAGVSDERILTAVGWPIEPTGQSWKD